MKIFVLGSMQFSEQMIAARDELISQGHTAITSSFVEPFIGKDEREKEHIKLEQKNHQDAIKVDCAHIPDQDAVVVVNLEKHGIPGYIGGNVLIELGYAHILGKQIYLLNPIPEIPYYKTELEAIKPIILHGDLTSIQKAQNHSF